jgi:hypothetical protein
MFVSAKREKPLFTSKGEAGKSVGRRSGNGHVREQYDGEKRAIWQQTAEAQNRLDPVTLDELLLCRNVGTADGVFDVEDSVAFAGKLPNNVGRRT